jgi:hypothetical protein
MPRAFIKTWVGTIGFAIWLTLSDEESLFKEVFPFKGPNIRILIASNVIDNAAKMIYKIKQEWMNNDRLKAAFPELIPDFNKTRWSDHVAEVKREIKSTEGTYTAVGAGGSVISQHFDIIIEDDLIYAKKDDFSGQELMPGQEDIDNAIGWHKISLSLLANPQTGCVYNIGTRWAPQDLINYIRTREQHYCCFEVSATKGAQFPIESDADCTWAARYNKKVLDELAASQGARIFETQYLNRPRAMEDILFRTSYVHQHESIDEYPIGIPYKTVVDLAGWGDSKGTARNVIITGGYDEKSHLWIARLDVGRYTPSDVISIFKSHSRQFESRIHIEEIQYQRAISHFSRKEMEETGEWFSQERLPFDGRKGAKDLRIRSLEPLVSNGALHIMTHMKYLLEELDLFPHSRTVDILDCLGYLLKIAKKPVETRTNETRNQFQIENIEQELRAKGRKGANLPFDFQLKSMGGVRYGRN